MLADVIGITFAPATYQTTGKVLPVEVYSNSKDGGKLGKCRNREFYPDGNQHSVWFNGVGEDYGR